MKSTYTLVAFLLLALALTGAGLFLWMGDDPTAAPPLVDDEPTTPLGAQVETSQEPGETELVAIAAEEEPEREVANPNEAAEATATWVEGLAQMPAGAPADPDLQAYALASDMSYSDFARHMLEDHLNVLAQSSVGADGSFRLPFPEDRTSGWVILRGRFLYQLEAVKVDLSATGPTVRPRAELGACISGPVLVPDGVEGLSEDFELRLRSEIGDSNPTSDRARLTRMRFLLPLEDGQYRSGAVPLPMEYVLAAEDSILAGARLSITDLQPGEERVVPVRLTRGGSLSGRVVNMDAQPVSGATVEASLSGSFFGLDDHVVRKTETDETGAFELTGVPADEIRLVAKAEGMLPSKRLKEDLTEGGEVTGLVLEVDEGGVLTGQVRWDVGGLAAGVEINVRFDPAFMAGLDALGALRGADGKATTDEDGRFRVTGLGKGPFVVRAKAEAPWDESEEEGEAVPWTGKLNGVRPGTGELELVLRAPVGLRGRVVDDLDEPVQTFRLFLQQASGGPMAGLAALAGGESKRERKFDSKDGSFLVEGLEAGSYQVWVRDDEHVSLEPLVVDLTDDALPVRIVAARAARVSGVVRTPQDEPCEGAQVGPGGGGLDLQALTKGGPEPPSTKSDESGHFELAGIAPGAQSITAQSDDWAASPPLTVQLAPGEHLEDVTLLLSMGGNLTGEIFDDEGNPATGHMVTIIGLETMLSSGGLSQRISMSDGEGHFHFEHLEPGSWQVTAIDRSQEWASDDGALDMGNLMSSIKLTQADIVEGETTHVVLGAPPEDPVHVFGDVTLAGAAYSDATLSFIQAGQGLGQGLKFTAVDDDGSYELVLDGAGKYQVNVQRLAGGAGQQSTIEFSIEIPQTTEHRLDFVLPLGRISGRIMGPDREPAVGARVTVTLDEDARSDRLFGGQYSELQADDEGRFDVVGLRPGTYRVSAGGAAFMGLGSSDLGRVTRGDLKLDEDEWMENVDLALPGAGTLALTVTGPDGGPAAGATIFVRDAQGRPLEPFSMLATDATGRVKYEGLAPGNYTVLARTATHTSHESGTVTVRQDQSTSVELSLGEGTILWVQIKEGGKDGMPLPGSVRVIDEHGRDVASLLGIQDLQLLYAKGGFENNEHRLGPLPAGRYVVEVDSDGRTKRKPVNLSGGGERRIVIRLR